MVVAVFALAMDSETGRYAPATALAILAAGTDYFDGLVARLTGQFSRLGALLDPLVDRLLVVTASIVCWRFELLPRAALAILLVRELLMLALSVPALRAGLEIKVNWAGRLAVWPIMGGLCLALLTETWVSAALLWVGVVGACYATFLYVRDMLPAAMGKSVQDLNP